MKHGINLEYLQIAKDLTGSSDIDYLIEAARKIEQFSKGQIEPRLPTFLDFAITTRLPSISAFQGWQSWEPYQWQLDMVELMDKNDQTIFITGRHIGATTALMAWAIYEAITKPGSTIGVLFPKFAGALEALERARFMIEKSTLAMPGVTTWTKNEIVFQNGSRILGRTAEHTSVIGMSFSHLILADFAYVAYSKEGALWIDAKCHLNYGGKLVVQSSVGATNQGLFRHLWAEREERGLVGMSIPWTVVTRAPDYEETLRAAIGDEEFAVQYENRLDD